MKHLRSMTFLAFICIFIKANAQLSTNEKPISFDTNLGLSVISKSAVPNVITPHLDMAKIEQEDKEDEEYDMPPRFGYRHKVNYNLNNSGTWYELANGDKLWQLNVVCPNALSVNFCYDKFWIPDGGKFFVYSKDQKQSIGAFTSRNNKGDRENIRGFATGLVYGSEMVLEYYQPKEVTIDAIISIEYIVHGYKYINWGQRTLGASCSYMVNINCDEGQDWQIEKRAVAKLIIQGNYLCSGSLINTTDLSEKPFLLTADHCIDFVGKDATEDTNLDYTFFYWNYEVVGCDNLNMLPFYSTQGATVIANNDYSDFALLQLSEDPKNLSNYTPYYLGWDCSGQSGDPGVCIHHPKGDVKKISTVKNLPVSSYWYSSSVDNHSHWEVAWKQTEHGHGVTQGGSSGSPLLTASHKLIGQLHGSTCNDCNNLNGHSYYGKFNVSWTGNSNNSIQRRLNYWIDSLNVGSLIMEGLLIIPSAQTMTTNQQLYSNIRIDSSGQLTIQGDIELMGNSCVIVEAGGELIIDGGTLSNVDIVLKSGASLRIINGGIIETRNGFEAPIGSTVDIVSGQIL